MAIGPWLAGFSIIRAQEFLAAAGWGLEKGHGYLTKWLLSNIAHIMLDHFY